MQNITSMIYFIRQGIDGPIKIGFSEQEDIIQRKAMLQTGNPFELSLLKIVDGNRLTERLVHEKFQDARINENREWFYPTNPLLRFIQSLRGEGEIENLNSYPPMTLEERIIENVQSILGAETNEEISLKYFIEKYMQEVGVKKSSAYHHFSIIKEKGIVSV